MRSTGLSRPGVYRIDVAGTAHVYVGSTVNVRVRWNAHRKDLRAGRHRNAFLQRCFHKYGEAALQFTVLEFVEDRESVRRREQHWIDALSTDLNLSPSAGGLLGFTLSSEARAKISDGNKRRWANTTPDEREAHGKAVSIGIKACGRPPTRLGAVLSAETRAKISAGNKGKPGTNKGKISSAKTRAKISAARTGKPLSAEHRAAIGAAHKGQKRSPETRAAISAGVAAAHERKRNGHASN